MRVVRRALRGLRDFWQRGRRGWADSDTWGFDTYLAGVIADGLRHLKSYTNGYPGSLDSQEEWFSRLDDIIFAFDYQRGDPWIPEEWTQEWYESTAAIDAKYGVPHSALTEAEFERYRRGLRYFIEHFQSLWD